MFIAKFVSFVCWFRVGIIWGVGIRGLHGLKIEARTRPVPEIVWPDPTRAAQLNLEPEPEIPPPPQLASDREKDTHREREMDACEPVSVRLFLQAMSLS